MANFRNRVLMLDLARLMDHQERYRFWLPWLKEWGYNTLHLHLTDDEGCALVFPRRPELASPGAFTADQMRAFIAEAGKHGISVIPEIESLGHTKFITGHRRYRHLLARPPRGVDGHPWGFNALLPDHPETRQLLMDLFQDTAEIFDHEVIHAGLDEVDLSRFGGGKGTPWETFARHTAWVHDAIRRLDRRPAMWADHVVAAPEMAKRFERDVLMVDWHYEAGVRPDSLDTLARLGFEVWAAPATMWWRVRLLTNPGSFANVREFTGYALRRRKTVTGMVNTVWCPYRHLPGTMDWPIAWAGHVFSEKEENPGYCREFCRSFYGLPSVETSRAAEALSRLHAAAPDAKLYEDVLADRAAPHPRFTREHQRQCAERVTEFDATARILAAAVRKAGRNADRLNDVVLSARLLERWARYGAAGLCRSALPPAPGLLKACRTSWTRSRVNSLDIHAHGFQNPLLLAES